jgi:hypothetical protein
MKTVSIQVLPCYEEHDGVVTDQPCGPNEYTSYWSIYGRKEDGTVEWLADVGNEDDAMWIGDLIAVDFCVKIEPQPWKTK